MIPTSTKDTPILFESDEDYFAHPNCWGSTDAKRLHQSPQLAHDHRTGIVPPTDSAAFAFGRAWDCMMTTPDSFADRFIVRPDGVDGRTKAGKEWIADAQASGKEVLKQDDINRLDLMANRMPQEIRDRLDSAMFSQAVLRHPHYGESWETEPLWYAQAKVDLMLTGLMVDIKTTSDSLENFVRSAYKFGYHIQAGWYRRIYQLITGKLLPFEFCVTETASPFRTAWFTPDERFYFLGMSDAQIIESGITACYALGSWHDIQPFYRDLPLPAWVQVD